MTQQTTQERQSLSRAPIPASVRRWRGSWRCAGISSGSISAAAMRRRRSGQRRTWRRSAGRKIFEVVIIDLEDLASVRAAVAAIGAPLNALAMNAGGIGGPTPASLTQDGVTEIFAQNLLGHVVLLENLLAAGLLTDVAVLVGARRRAESRSCGSPDQRSPITAQRSSRR